MKRSDVALALGAALPFLLGKSSKQGGFNKWDDLEGDKPTTWFDYAFRDESFPGERLQPDFQNWNQFKMLKRYFKEGVDVFTDIIGTVLGKVKPAPQVKTMFIASAMQNIPFPEFEQVYKDKHPKASEQDAKFAYKAASIAARDETIHSLLFGYISWSLSGKNVLVVGEDMQRMFENTSLDRVTGENIGLAMDGTVYVALPGFKGRMFATTHNPNAFNPNHIDHTSATSLNEAYYIRGVAIQRFTDPNGHDVLKLSFWGKPKIKNGIVSDHFYNENLPTNQNLETTLANMQILSKSVDFGDPRLNLAQPKEGVESIVLAARIAINTLMYWQNMKDRVDLVHPDLKAIYEKIKEIQQKMAEAKPNSKRWRGLNGTLQGLLKRLEREGNWSFIDPKPPKKQDVSDAPDEPVVAPPQASPPFTPQQDITKRKTPYRHPNRGHWKRRYPRRQGNTEVIFIYPYFSGTGAPAEARYLVSILDKYKELREQADRQLGSSNRNLLNKLPRGTWVSSYDIAQIWNMSEFKANKTIQKLYNNGSLIYDISVDKYMRK
jgi:hypothetical protein